MLAYMWTPKQDPIPEVSFPFFLQHMLYTGEVYAYMYMHLYEHLISLENSTLFFYVYL